MSEERYKWTYQTAKSQYEKLKEIKGTINGTNRKTAIGTNIQTLWNSKNNEKKINSKENMPN